MGGKPKYIDTYNKLKKDITTGKYPSGTLLPTEMEMCRLYSVGRSTLRRVLSMLSGESLVSSRQGHGTTVTFPPDEYTKISPIGLNLTYFTPVCLLDGELSYTSSPLAVDTVFASDDVAKKMRLPAGTKIFRVQRIRYVNNRAFCYVVNYVNPALAPELDKQDIGPHITEFLVKHYGVKRTSVDGTLYIGKFYFKQSQFLGIEMDCPCFVQGRIGYVNDQVYDYSEQIYNPDIIEFHVKTPPNAELDEIVPEK
jgi:GntR family transcriptional regulator